MGYSICIMLRCEDKDSRAKASGIILRIWCSIPHERVALRDTGVALLPRISGQERIWLHWGMTTLAYPSFRDIAEIVDRLLTFQNDLKIAQVQGLVLTTWGDRTTSREAAQNLITSLVDWGVLREADPIQDIHNTTRIAAVIQKGRLVQGE